MAAAWIHPSAVVDPSARLGEDVWVGPHCVVGAEVEIGAGCRLEAHVVVYGPTSLGPGNLVSPMAVLGGPPQHRDYRGEPTRLVIGAGNQIREGVTIHRGTVQGGGLTRVGDGNLFMAYAHVGHDCQVGDRTVFVNGATLAGHVLVEDGATIGAFSGVHQFCRVGREAFIGGYSVVTQDALPWVLTVGNRAQAHGINAVGMRRGGYEEAVIRALRRCYRIVFRSGLGLAEGLQRAEEELGEVAEVRYFLEFIRSSRRGVCR